jgi:hypothetical protein
MAPDDWKEASANYANGASGDVKCYRGDNLRPGNVYEGTEKNAIDSNKSIGSITEVDNIEGTIVKGEYTRDENGALKDTQSDNYYDESLSKDKDTDVSSEQWKGNVTPAQGSSFTATFPGIRVESPFPLIELTSFKVVQRENEHACAEFTGVLEEAAGITALLGKIEGEIVRFTDLRDDSPIFAGYIYSAEIEEQLGYFALKAVALSASYKLDLACRNRSYQDVTLLYDDVLRMALDEGTDPDYNGADFIIRPDDKPTDIPLVQYEETAWEFAKRLASHFKTTITPEMESGLPRFWIGLRSFQGKSIDFSDCEYSAKIDEKYLEVGGKQLWFPRDDFFTYIVRDITNHALGSSAQFRGEDLNICRKSCEMDADGFPVYSYTLGREGLLAHKRFYNDNLIGRTLFGKVIDTQGGTVKLHLNIDKSQDLDTAFCYRWAPTSGNYMYLMPKIGSNVSLYFRDPGEGDAMAINCVRIPAARKTKGFSNVKKRNLSTEHGKNMLFYPKRFGIESKTSGGPLQIMCDDDGGMILETVNRINIVAEGDLTLEAPKIDMKSPAQVGLFYTAGNKITSEISPPTSVIFYQGGTVSKAEGKTVNLLREVIPLPSVDIDTPGKNFDWGESFDGVQGGTAVVGNAAEAATDPDAINIAGGIPQMVSAGPQAIAEASQGKAIDKSKLSGKAINSAIVGMVTGAIKGKVTARKVSTTYGEAEDLSKAMEDLLKGEKFKGGSTQTSPQSSEPKSTPSNQDANAPVAEENQAPADDSAEASKADQETKEDALNITDYTIPIEVFEKAEPPNNRVFEEGKKFEIKGLIKSEDSDITEVKVKLLNKDDETKSVEKAVSPESSKEYNIGENKKDFEDLKFEDLTPNKSGYDLIITATNGKETKTVTETFSVWKKLKDTNFGSSATRKKIEENFPDGDHLFFYKFNEDAKDKRDIIIHPSANYWGYFSDTAIVKLPNGKSFKVCKAKQEKFQQAFDYTKKINLILKVKYKNSTTSGFDFPKPQFPQDKTSSSLFSTYTIDQLDTKQLSDLIARHGGDGVLNRRFQTGNKYISLHSFGVDIDINTGYSVNGQNSQNWAKINREVAKLSDGTLTVGADGKVTYTFIYNVDDVQIPFIVPEIPKDIPQGLINFFLHHLAFKKYGFTWGAYFSNTDAMHFSLVEQLGNDSSAKEKEHTKKIPTVPISPIKMP